MFSLFCSQLHIQHPLIFLCACTLHQKISGLLEVQRGQVWFPSEHCVQKGIGRWGTHSQTEMQIWKLFSQPSLGERGLGRRFEVQTLNWRYKTHFSLCISISPVPAGCTSFLLTADDRERALVGTRPLCILLLSDTGKISPSRKINSRCY